MSKSKKPLKAKPLTIVIPTFCNLHPDYKQDLYYKIKNFFSSIFIHPPRTWARKTYKVIQYIPTIWNDYDWDYVYIYKLLKYKLERTYKEINDGYEVEKSKKKRLKNLTECIAILNRLTEDSYCYNEWDTYHSKYPFKNEWVKDDKGWLSSKPKISDKAKYKELERISKKENMLRAKDRTNLFNLMASHIEDWWS